MHLKVHKFSVDGMFGWRMEMKLSTMEIGFWNMLVKETDGTSLQIVETIMGVVWLLDLLQGEGVGLNSLVELVGGFWIDGLVVELEHIILEIFQNWHVGLQINRGAFDHIDGLICVMAFTWSLSHWVSPVLGVVVHVGVLMFLATVRDTEFFVDCGVIFVTFFNFRGTKFHKVNSILEYSILFHLLESFLLDSGLGELALAHCGHALHSLELTLVLLVVLSLPFFIFHVFENLLFNEATIDLLDFLSDNTSLSVLFLILV